MISAKTFQPVVEDQLTAARAYFLCIIGMLFCESLIRLPSYFMTYKKGGARSSVSPAKHWKPYVLLHKIITLPPLLSFITRHRLPSLFRLFVFVFLNFLWGWNRLLYSTDYKLYGWLTIANAGLGLLLAARTNLFSIVLRIPTPILLNYHRWIGRATFAHATLHLSLTIQQFVRTDQFAAVVVNARIRVGIVAWVALAIVYITSLSFIRRRWFEVFYYAHFLFLVFIAGALYHASKGPEFLLPGLGLWAIDRVIRFAHRFRKIVVKSVTYYPRDLTKFKFEGVQAAYPGQMAWIQVPSISYLNWHPFSIASAPGDSEGTIAIRGLGNYSKKAQLLAETRKCEDRMDSETGGQEVVVGSMPMVEASAVRMVLDGPYGIGRLQWDRYRTIVIVAGGIGITPGISIASYIVNRAAASTTTTTTTTTTGMGFEWHIHLLWVIKEKKHSQWFADELKKLASLAANPSMPVTMDVTIHVTGGGNSSEQTTTAIGQEEFALDNTVEKYDGPGIVHHHRPNLSEWFRCVKDGSKDTDIAVSLCGPKAMMNDARKAAAKASVESGVFHVEEEEFEL